MMSEDNNYSSNRLISIDALRGFNFFWILGASEFFIALLTIKKVNWTLRLAVEFDHSAWHGFTFYDLIFPLFLFIVGVVIPFSLSKYQESSSENSGKLYINYKHAYKRIIVRTVILIILGLVVNGFLDFNFSSMRWPGVLQRIAICYFFSSIITLHTPPKFRPLINGVLIAITLIGYWAIMKLIPAPGATPGDLSPQGNLAGYIDRLVIPGRFCCYQFGDNEGLLSTIPSLGTTLIGVSAGLLLMSKKLPIIKIKWLFISAIVSLALGIIWSFDFPRNKILWTSSFVLFAAGWSLLLLGLFYLLIDYKGYKKWAFPFVVVGKNAITIYVIQMLFDFGIIVDIFVHGFIKYFGVFKETFFFVCLVAVKWLFLYFLYKKKIFLKV